MESAAALDERGFRLCMDRAERLTGPDVTPGLFGEHGPFVASEAETASNVGVGMLLLGRPGEAVAALGESLRLRPTQWRTRRVVPLVDTAAAHLLRQEPEQACAALLDALGLALDAGYLAGLERLRGVRARFPAEWSGLECVADLDERLRSVA